MWKGRSWKDKLLKSRVEDVLKEFGICMGQYHGRDLEGPAVWRPLDHAGDFFARISTVLCEFCPEEMKAETNTMCKHYQTLFEMLEGATYFMRKPNGLVTDDDIEKFQEFVDAVMLKWRALGLSITVKAHLLESHAYSQMLYYHGIGDFIEEFVEQLHQFTKRHKRRMGRLSDFKKESDAIAKVKRIESNPLVMGERSRIAELTKRKNKSGNETLHERRKKQAREDKTNERNQNLETYMSNGDLGDHVLTFHVHGTADFLREQEKTMN